MKKGIFLHNTVHVETDSFGAYSEQSPVVGFDNFGDEGKPYYSFDEVEDLLKNGFIDNNICRDENGRLYLNSSYCSYCSALRIVCGQVVSEITDKNKGIYDYCKKIGLIQDEFVPVKGWFGTKTMLKNEDGTFNIYYVLDNFDTSRWNIEFVEKICVGSIKQLAGVRERCHRGNELEVSPRFICSDVKFNRANKQLIIESIPKEYVTGEVVATIVTLDLELWMMCNENKQWSRFFTASLDLVKDMGQAHWFSSLEKESSFDKNRKCNIDWFDKKLGEEWE